MGFFTSLETSLSAVEAARARMEACSSNLANADSSAPDDASLYRVRRILLREASGLAGPGRPAGVSYQWQELDQAARLVYDPDHPDADQAGLVRYPEVDMIQEMAELMAARRAYEAGLTVYSEARALFLKSLEIGRA
ncbi:MAG: flagellar basal body rod protein FlgC [Candidatus Eremiobacterota bacterium]